MVPVSFGGAFSRRRLVATKNRIEYHNLFLLDNFLALVAAFRKENHGFMEPLANLGKKDADGHCTVQSSLVIRYVAWLVLIIKR